MTEPYFCPKCEEELIKVDHYEPDGVTEYGSHEICYECVNGCNIDDELTEINEEKNV